MSDGVLPLAVSKPKEVGMHVGAMAHLKRVSREALCVSGSSSKRGARRAIQPLKNHEPKMQIVSLVVPLRVDRHSHVQNSITKS